MNNLPWFPLDAKQWLVGTAGMTKAEKGVFIDLLCYQWENGSLGSIPNRLPIECADEWAVLKAKFVEGISGELVNPKLHKIRLERESLLMKQVEGGKKGARSRYGSPNKSPMGNQSKSKKRESEKESESDAIRFYSAVAERYHDQQRIHFPNESVLSKDIPRLNAESAMELERFERLNGWPPDKITGVLKRVLDDPEYRKNIISLRTVRHKSHNGSMKLENADRHAGGGVAQKDNWGGVNKALREAFPDAD